MNTSLSSNCVAIKKRKVNYFCILEVFMKKRLFLVSLLFINFFCYAKSNVFYSVSSYLQEGEEIYGPDNLSKITGLPWASGSGFGLHETITLENLDINDKYLIFYNGYQSKEKPHLYRNNSRLKTGRLFNSKGNYINIDFEDTQKYKIIDISELFGNELDTTISMEIVDVYPGIKYKDLCIQAILPLKDYFNSADCMNEIKEIYSFQQINRLENIKSEIGEDLYYASRAGFPETISLSNSDIEAYYWKKDEYTVLKVLSVYNKNQMGILDVFFDINPKDIEKILGINLKHNNVGYFFNSSYTYFIEFEKANDKILKITFGENL